MGNTKLLQRVIFMLLALSLTSSLFALDEDVFVINPVANDEVVMAEEVYAAYCNPEEFNALAKKVRDGASFIPFREEELLEDGLEKHALANYVKNKIDFGGFALNENFTKEEIQQEIDRYKRNAKFHRANLVEYLDIFFSETHLEKNSRIDGTFRGENPYVGIRDIFYMAIKIKETYYLNTDFCPRKDKY